MSSFCYICPGCKSKMSVWLLTDEVMYAISCPECEENMIRDWKEESVGFLRSSCRATKERVRENK